MKSGQIAYNLGFYMSESENVLIQINLWLGLGIMVRAKVEFLISIRLVLTL